jgi:CheY-like chemotaxis protein
MSLSDERKPVILIIDDDETTRIITQKLLEKFRFKVLTRSNVPDGIDALQDQKETPDLVILDLQMPGITGFDFLEGRKKGKINPKIPVIVLSNHQDPTSVYRAIALGANDYAIKTHDFGIVVTKVMKRLNLQSVGITFKSDETPTIQIKMPGWISKISETSLLFEGKIRIGEQAQVKLQSDILNELGCSELVFRKSPIPAKQLSGTNIYSNGIDMMGLSMEALKRIRAFLKGSDG